MNREQLKELYQLILATWNPSSRTRPYSMLKIAGDLEAEVDSWLYPLN